MNVLICQHLTSFQGNVPDTLALTSQVIKSIKNMIHNYRFVC